MSTQSASWTVMKIIRWTTAYFHEKHILEPRVSAEVLLAQVLGVNRLNLYLRYDQPLTPQELARFRALVKRRAAGEPTAYLTGHKEFWSLDFKVTPAVLIPRPETEVLVEAVLDVFKGEDRSPQFTENRKPKTENRLWGLEIGVGSGAVVTVLAKEVPAMIWAAVDISRAALVIARDNARHHQVAGCIHFLQGNLFSGLKPGPRFALVAANLPYVSETEWLTLPRDIREYEPREALLGGKDGLALLKPLARQAHHYLRSGGWLALEVGLGQAQILREELGSIGAYDRLELVQDYQGIDRVVRARRR